MFSRDFTLHSSLLSSLPAPSGRVSAHRGYPTAEGLSFKGYVSIDSSQSKTCGRAE